MIETKNLTKTFDNFTAVDSLDLKIETGEFFGLLGPNGAGKRLPSVFFRPSCFQQRGKF